MPGSWEALTSRNAPESLFGRIMYREGIGALLDSLGLNGKGIEIGVAEGDYSRHLINSTRLSKIYLLDAWKNFDSYIDQNNVSQAEHDKRHLKILELTAPYKDRVTVIRADCLEACSRFEDSFFDFIYIDADHKYEFVKRNIQDWFPKLKAGGIFAGHDYLDGMVQGSLFGVKRAVDEFAAANGYRVWITTHDTPVYAGTDILVPDAVRYRSWYLQKR